MTSAAGPDTWRTVTIRAGIAAYWLTMFLATHLPVVPVIERLPTSDKHLHFGAYAVLGCALPWALVGIRKISWARSGMLLAIMLVYACLDELLQIPVGRSCEIGDWLADAAGGVTGLAIGTRLAMWRMR